MRVGRIRVVDHGPDGVSANVFEDEDEDIDFVRRRVDDECAAAARDTDWDSSAWLTATKAGAAVVRSLDT